MENMINLEQFADGGAWRNEAIQNIKKYLEEELKELKHIKIIA